MSTRHPLARITITLPRPVLEAADKAAARLDRSRSWVVAEAIRRFGEELSREHEQVRRVRESNWNPGLGYQRLAQLTSDLALTPEKRVRAGEESADLGELVHSRPRLKRVVLFDTFEDYLAWKKRDAIGFP